MKKRPLSVGCLVVVILICIVTSLSRKEPWNCPDLEGQTVIVQGRVYQKEVKNLGGQDKTIVYLKQVSFAGEASENGWSIAGERPVERQPEKSQSEEGQLPVQEKCAERLADIEDTENILCYLREGVPEPEVGSLVILKGTLKNFQQPTNPGQFNAPFYYQILRISFRLDQAEIQVKSDKFYKISEGLYQLRRKAGSKMDALLPEQEASVMKTMLLGEKGILDEEIKGLYQRNGIAHILAISGVYALSLAYINICKTPIFCPFWAFYIPIITLFLIPIFAHNCTLSYGVKEKSIFWRKYKHLRKSLLFGERKENA